MTIRAGTRLGPYEIVSAIGAGGMGEVYRGVDTRLDRHVAIKILPPDFAQNEQFRLRFEREAKTISSLNHPNICTLFDVGHVEGTDYLVMELIEGESLADRIEKGPLPADQVLKIGAQICDALDRAHQQGITHRDLKPGNIMLTKSGAKLLDFGLARSTLAPASSPRLDISATQAKPLTEQGTILGTFQYMAPEQLEGSEADARTDIFALGALLYEMATARRAFGGKSRTSLIAAIVSSQPPPISSVQQMSPLALDHVVRKCLEKDPEDRWQSARDVASELRWISEAGSHAGVAAPLSLRRKTRESIAWALVALLIVATGFLAQRAFRRPSPVSLRLSLAAPPGTKVSQRGGNVAISPDGRYIAFVGSDATGRNGLFIRSMSESSARLLSGTGGATYPFWSTDSAQVAFFSEGKLKKVSVSSTDVDVICAAPDARGGTWNRDGVIVFSPNVADALQRVDAHGGSPQAVTTLNVSRETTHRFPWFLPDGDHFLFMSDSKNSAPSRVMIGSLSEKTTKLLTTSERAPVYAEPGFLVYAIEDRVVAQRFDAKNLRLDGPPVRFPEHPPAVLNTLGAAATVSANGLLVTAAAANQNTRLVWLDRRGSTLGSLPLPPGSFDNPRISPDGRQVSLSGGSGGEAVGDLWLVDLEHGAPTRLTFGPRMNRYAVWSPDGKTLAFQSDRSGSTDLYLVSSTGGAAPVLFTPTAGDWKRPETWSPDGSMLIFEVIGKESGYDLWIATRGGKARPYAATAAAEIQSSISPDGRWAAYESTESGRTEILVQSFPTPGTRYQVTTTGGSGVHWTSGGRELVFLTQDGKIASIAVTGSDALQFGPQQILFNLPDVTGIDVTRDGQRFLVTMNEDTTAAQSFTVVANWAEGLR